LIFTAWGSARGDGGREEPWPPWIFIDDTEKEGGGLRALFFGLVLSVAPPPKIFLPTPLIHSFLA